MAESTPFGTLLRSLRLAKSLTLEALAAASGLSERTIGDLERGVSTSPQRRTIDALAHGLGLDESATHRLLRAARARPRQPRPAPEPSQIAPHRLLDFAGREKDIRRALDVLDAVPPPSNIRPALIISGAPGIGKTTTAVEILARAQSADQMTVFVGLEGTDTTPLTPLQILAAMLRQLPGADDKPPKDLESAARQWRTAADAAPARVFWDNAADEQQLRPLLAICAPDTVVVTSRRSLAGLSGARRLRLEPLQRFESVELLRRLIPQADTDRAALEEMAALCDDVPLALTVVGNRLSSRPGWSLADMLRRLRSTEDRLRLLVAGDLAVESAIALSYEELDPSTAALFRWTAIIVGETFDAELAAASAGASDVSDVEFRLEDLTDLGLLEPRGGNRYRLHDLLRLFALNRLRAETGSVEIERRRKHLRSWLLGSLERAGAWFEPHREPKTSRPIGRAFSTAEEAASWIRGEVGQWWPAYREAASSGEHAVVVDVADALHWYSDVWLAWSNWHPFFSVAVDAARAMGDARMEATHLGYLAWAQIVEVGDRIAAVETARTALVAADRSGDLTQRGWANYYLAWATWLTKHLDQATAAAAAAVAAFVEAGDEAGLENARLMTTVVRNARGEHLQAIQEMNAVLERLRAGSGEQPTFIELIAQYSAHLDLSDAYLAVGRFDDSIRATDSGIEIARMLDDDLRVVMMMRRRVRARIHAGELDLALAEVDEALALIGPGSSEAFLFTRFRDEIPAIRDGRAPRSILDTDSPLSP